MLSCDFVVTELPVAGSGTPQLSARLGATENFQPHAFELVCEWPDENGHIICTSSRLGADYLFSFPGYASYQISPDGVIHCIPEPGCPGRLLRHFLINQVIPRFLGSQGEVIVHASAVKLSDGRAVAFLGNSGFGKSTLAASFAQSGAVLLADDCVLINRLDGALTVVGAFPGVRLFTDSREAIFSDNSGFEQVATQMGKHQAVLSGPLYSDRLLLARLFALNDPAVDADSVSVMALPGANALLKVVSSLFTLNPADEATTVRSFKAVKDLIAGSLPCSELHYPRELDILQEVRAAVEEAAV